jgi:hypothetical protein
MLISANTFDRAVRDRAMGSARSGSVASNCPHDPGECHALPPLVAYGPGDAFRAVWVGGRQRHRDGGQVVAPPHPVPGLGLLADGLGDQLHVGDEPCRAVWVGGRQCLRDAREREALPAFVGDGPGDALGANVRSS